ncbi:MAG: DUF4388 domain-containing protein [Acidobacteriota bacterium]
MSTAADVRTILVVDPDPFLQEMIEAGFRLFNPSWTMLRAASPSEAFSQLHVHEVSAVITELEFPDARPRGVEFLLALEDRIRRFPVIVLSSAPADTFRDLVRVEAFLSKPPDMDLLLRTVHQAIQEESIVRGITLTAFLQMLELESKTCTLTVSAGLDVGRLFIRDGILIHAEAGRRVGRPAAYAIIGWDDPLIKVSNRCEIEPTMSVRLHVLVMDWAVDRDHGVR